MASSRARKLADLLDAGGDVKQTALDNAPDPDLTPYALNTAIANASNWDEAYSWGDHRIVRSATEPTNPQAGDIWYDATEEIMKHYDGSVWLNMSNKFVATGGTVSQSNGYVIHTFTSSGTFEVLSGEANVEFIVVGGGGGSASNLSGGGGGGGYRSSVVGEVSGGGNPAEAQLRLSEGYYTVTVGAGGAGRTSDSLSGINGSNSVFHTITSIGGGGSGAGNGTAPALSGGSGGGGSGQGNLAGAPGTSGQGFAGGNGQQNSNYPAGGGGGASQAGSSPSSNTDKGGDGGDGVQSNIDFNNYYYAGGGGGGSYTGSNGAGNGGLGGGGGGEDESGGGDGLDDTSGRNPATNHSGGINTGGGAGGAANSGTPRNGHNGGSGIVIVRYAA